MKLLFDQNLSFKLCERIGDLFPNSGHVRLLRLDRAEDRTIWQYARDNGYTLVTLDADFAEMSTILGPPPKVIWLRRGNQPTAAIASILQAHVELIRAFEFEIAACLEIY